MSTTEHGWRRPSAGGITPLYKRLPKGPHGIAPEDVVHHQRIRMHGAMIEAIALHGYERTSVKHVIGLAGVSRRAFYEQFANKEDCFMETFDLIVNRTVRRVSGACRAGEGSLEKRTRAGLRALVEELETNPKALHLVFIDALMAGPEGQLRLRRAMAASEQLLAGGFHPLPSERPPPGPLVRAIVGGLRRAVFSRLREGRIESRSVLSGEMLRWTMLFASPHIDSLQLRPSSKPPLPRVVQMPRLDTPSYDSDKRTRMLQSVLNLALREPYEELSAPHIAEEADLSIDTFLELFESPRDCFVAALDMLGGDLLEVVADPGLVSEDWPEAVCQAIDRLTSYLVANPAATVTLAAKTFGAGIGVIADMVTLTDEVTTLLTEGAPRRASTRLAPEWISGALAHTVHTEVFSGRAHLLGSLNEYLSYAVLAPYIGPEEAAQTIVKARSASAHGVASAPGSASIHGSASVDGSTSAREGALPDGHVTAEDRAALVGDAIADSDKAARDGKAGELKVGNRKAGERKAAEENADADASPQQSAASSDAALGEVREHHTHQQRDHDHDDQRSLA